jgi:hypothetical protein
MADEQLDYQAFLRTVQPTEVGLKTCSSKLNRVGYWQLFSTEAADWVRSLRPAYALAQRTKDYFDVSGKLSLTIGPPGDDAPRVLEIDCEFELHVHVSEPFDEAFAKRFADNEARLIVWPYFREFISSLTSRMGIPSLVIPITLRPVESPAARSGKRITTTKRAKPKRLSQKGRHKR